MTGPVKIMIVEDQDLVREGLTALLADAPNIVVSEKGAADGLEALGLMSQIAPDLVIMDLFMPNMDGINATRDIKRRYPKTKVLILTMSEQEGPIADAMRAGADGYIMKRTSRSEFLQAIETVMAGRPYFCSEVNAQRIQAMLKSKGQKGFEDLDMQELEGLTYRERQILKLVAEGNKNKEMAKLLGISLKTIETHRLNMMRKLGLHSAAEITAFAYRTGVLEK